MTGLLLFVHELLFESKHQKSFKTLTNSFKLSKILIHTLLSTKKPKFSPFPTNVFSYVFNEFMYFKIQLLLGFCPILIESCSNIWKARTNFQGHVNEMWRTRFVKAIFPERQSSLPDKGHYKVPIYYKVHKKTKSIVRQFL